MKYAEKFKDPRWQRKRLRIFERDGWSCQVCSSTDTTLHVHHRWYEKGKDPWEYPDECLVTLCEECHDQETIGMPKACEELIRAMKRHFFADSVSDIAAGFENLAVVDNPDEQATVIGSSLQTPKLMKMLVNDYFEFEQALDEEYQRHRETLVCRRDASS